LITFGQHRHWDYPTFIPVLSAAWGGFAMLLFTATLFTIPRQPDEDTAKKRRHMNSFWLRFVFLTPLIYLGVGWTVRQALRAGDPVSAERITIAALLGSLLCAAGLPR